jgi:hypothetical protein
LFWTFCPDRQKATLIEWLEKPPPGIDLSQLEAAATDLWAHYRDAVSAVFGDKVKIVADRFHVMQNLHEAIHEARRQAQQQANNEAERKQLKGLRLMTTGFLRELYLVADCHKGLSYKVSETVRFTPSTKAVDMTAVLRYFSGYVSELARPIYCPITICPPLDYQSRR